MLRNLPWSVLGNVSALGFLCNIESLFYVYMQGRAKGANISLLPKVNSLAPQLFSHFYYYVTEFIWGAKKVDGDHWSMTR